MSYLKRDIVLKKLEWSDVRASISWIDGHKTKKQVPWTDVSGKTRVYARLHACSQVGVVLWVRSPDFDRPALRAAILLKLHRVLKKKISMYMRYLTILTIDQGDSM